MTERVKLVTRKKPKTFDQDLLFGPAPVLDGENFDAYDELLARVSSDVQASDIFEEIWIRDIVDLTWEIFRYRRLKTSLIAAGVKETLTEILSPLVELPEVEEGDEQESESEDSPEHELAQQWVARDPAAIKQVNKLLASAGLTMDSVFSLVFASEIQNIERIDYLTTVVEGRRNAVMREIDRHRATLAQKLRGAVGEIEATEFETVKPLKTIGSQKRSPKGAA